MVSKHVDRIRHCAARVIARRHRGSGHARENGLCRCSFAGKPAPTDSCSHERCSSPSARSCDRADCAACGGNIPGKLAYNPGLSIDRPPSVHARCPPPCPHSRAAARGRSCARHRLRRLPAARSGDSARLQGNRVSRRAFPGRAGSGPGLKPRHPARHLAQGAHVACLVQRAADAERSTHPLIRDRQRGRATGHSHRPDLRIKPRRSCLRSTALRSPPPVRRGAPAQG